MRKIAPSTHDRTQYALDLSEFEHSLTPEAFDTFQFSQAILDDTHALQYLVEHGFRPADAQQAMALRKTASELRARGLLGPAEAPGPLARDVARVPSMKAPPRPKHRRHS